MSVCRSTSVRCLHTIEGAIVGLTQDLGAFIVRVGGESTSDEAHKVAKTGFTDCTATMIAGIGRSIPLFSCIPTGRCTPSVKRCRIRSDRSNVEILIAMRSQPCTENLRAQRLSANSRQTAR